MADEVWLPALDRALINALFDDRIGRVFIPANAVCQPQRDFLRRPVVFLPENLHDLPF